MLLFLKGFIVVFGDDDDNDDIDDGDSQDYWGH